MTASDPEKPNPHANALKTFVGLFVIWMSFYLVALAHDLSSRSAKSASPGMQSTTRSFSAASPETGDKP